MVSTSTLDKSLQLAMGQVPECVAAAYVDVASGMLLSVKTVDSHPQEILDMVSAATSDLFQGPTGTAIENMFKKARGVGDEQRFQEVVVFSDNLLHMFMRCRKNVNHVLVFVCRKSANLGMVIAKSQGLLASVDGSL